MIAIALEQMRPTRRVRVLRRKRAAKWFAFVAGVIAAAVAVHHA